MPKRRRTISPRAPQPRKRKVICRPTNNPALHYSVENFNPDNVISLGMMTICTHCHASKFQGETFNLCCKGGKLSLSLCPGIPQSLHALFYDGNAKSNEFLNKIRLYNSAFQITSFGCHEIKSSGWNPSFRVQGQVYHLMGSIEPDDNTQRYFQIYFIDHSYQETNTRMSNFQDLRRDIVEMLQELLHENNKYLNEFKSALEYVRENNVKDFSFVIKENSVPKGDHKGRYNVPTCNEVAILMPSEPHGHRDIVVHRKNDAVMRVSELHQAYDALQYPLFYPYGSDGWSINLKTLLGVTQLIYYRFLFMTRPENHLIMGRRLFQQYMVDAYAKIEAERLTFLRHEQKQIRAECYQDLRDNVLHNDNTNVGIRVVLPATFTGGPRYMHERQQDAMCYVREFGRPDLFVTVTTNPNWNEIKENLLPNQKPHDRPDLIVRVFRQRLVKFMKLLRDGAFGRVIAWLYSIEFQKRGLPHAHILLWLSHDSKIHPDMIDQAVCAEIPSKEQDPELYELVVKNMIHGPCMNIKPESPCMIDGKCSKKFPKEFVQTTEQGQDSYPRYRRRRPTEGNSFEMKVKNEMIEIDNSWVVPYNPWLLRQMQCHVNVEICSSIKAIKYVLKYVHKGNDQLTYTLSENRNDEIKDFVNARYIGSTEAAWRIFEMPLNERFPPVIHLSVHLENGQRVYFTQSNARNVAEASPPSTTLTNFFELCNTDDFAKTLKYPDVPKYYTWNASIKRWQRRKRGNHASSQDESIHQTSAIGRVYSISPKNQECYFLRILLHEVKGPTSFSFLRTYEGNCYATFREACLARGLLEDDRAHQRTLREACVYHSAPHLRQLFSIILSFCEPANPNELWNNFKEDLCQDYMFQEADQPFELALIDIGKQIKSSCNCSLSNFGLPEPSIDLVPEMFDQNVRVEQSIHDRIQQLTSDQKNLFDSFINTIEQNSEGIFFIDAPGGCGKTFLLETIIIFLRKNKKNLFATASSGLAATLLPGGRTVHSTFNVSLNIHHQDVPHCSIRKGTSLADEINALSAIIIDEAPMLNRIVYEALDRSLQDIRGNNRIMGGIPVLLCGDFRQLLPVVRGGTRANIVNSSIKMAYLWSFVKVFHLTTNMRVMLGNDLDAAEFAADLLTVGNGQSPIIDEHDTISISHLGKVVHTTDELINEVYHDIERRSLDKEWIIERAILCPLNETVNTINYGILQKVPSEEFVYKSYDTAISSDEALLYPVEFLNSLDIPGLPPHQLRLKLGAPVMLLRSISPPKLMNGTRCIVHSLHANFIVVELNSGPNKGELSYIPRIILEPSDSGLPFSFKRKQFPIRVCYAITINKSQGQTFKEVGIDLGEHVFTHGMLYVALSRCCSKSSVNIKSPEGRARNIVYPEILS